MNSLFLYSIVLLITLCHCVDILYNHTNKENNLYFVFTTFRHGARKPLHRIDFFGNRNYSAGVLTKYGKIQHLEIGRKYRKRYSNFVNMSFDKNEFYIYSSNVGRTIASTEKELEGFFNKTIDRSNIVFARGGGYYLYFMTILNLDPKKQAEINKYLASCSKRKLAKNFKGIYYREIFPNIKKCHLMENITDSGMNLFCDSIISHYFEYTYGNETYNIISRCNKESIQKFYNFCVEYFDSFRRWNELRAYIFFMLFQHIFQYMDNYIKGRSKIRMMIIGGHDVTLAPLMDFLNRLKIIPRTHYPHFACNIVIELRKYGQDFYLEIYYNDILKYNNTLEKFKTILNNTKYSNLYNYCGIPSYLNNTNNTTNQTMNNQTLKNESKIENSKNETNSNVNNQTEKKGNETQKENQSLQNSIKEKERETEKEKKNQGKNFLQKSFNYFMQQDMNFYILLICAFVFIVILARFVIFIFIRKKKENKSYIKFKETVSGKENPNNINVITSNDFEVKSET